MKTTHASSSTLRFALLLCAVPLYCAAESAADPADRACDIHAAAMVAEMKASSSTVLSAAEIALVRRTAYKSCIARAEPIAAAPIAAPAAAPSVSASDDTTPDNSLWGSFERLLKQPVERSPGHERLRKRSNTY